MFLLGFGAGKFREIKADRLEAEFDVEKDMAFLCEGNADLQVDNKLVTVSAAIAEKRKVSPEAGLSYHKIVSEPTPAKPVYSFEPAARLIPLDALFS